MSCYVFVVTIKNDISSTIWFALRVGLHFTFQTLTNGSSWISAIHGKIRLDAGREKHQNPKCTLLNDDYVARWKKPGQKILSLSVLCLEKVS